MDTAVSFSKTMIFENYFNDRNYPSSKRFATLLGRDGCLCLKAIVDTVTLLLTMLCNHFNLKELTQRQLF